MTSHLNPAHPELWDDQSLEAGRQRAIANFIMQRAAEGTVRYQEVLARNIAAVEELFGATEDLRNFGSGIALANHPALTRVARFLGGPPVSADDLDTLAEAKVASRRRLDLDFARKAAAVIEAALDARRLPWLFETPPRTPSDEERRLAIFWTAGLQTVEEVRTGRRGESARRQETAVEDLLTSSGFVKVAPRRIIVIDSLSRGEFSREALVAGTKCDIPVRLRDGRLLLIECKVSNSATNSVKRLNRECGGKSRTWREAFGAQAIPAAVLAGVFKLKNLRDSQAIDHLALF